jgi:RNA polymerase sigma-70 factor (ECF subfamily)
MFTHAELITVRPNLYKFALRLTRNESDAEDLLQSTVLRALEKRHLYEQGTNLFGWASKVMYNLFVTSYRAKSRFETQYDPDTFILKMSVDPAQEDACDLATVNTAMKSLSSEHRSILQMVCIRGLEYQDAAKALRVPVGTVRSRLSRARRNLQSLLEEGARPSTALLQQGPGTTERAAA